MQAMVVYSSQTGNTRKLAETVRDALPAGTQMWSVDEAPNPADYDFVALGFWLKAGKPDPQSLSYLERLQGHKKVFLFATHGARPGSEHAKNAMAHAQSLAEKANIAGSFSCYGEVDPKILEKVKAKPQPPVWLDDAAGAVGHPSPTDLENLRAALKAVLA